ncbi:SAM-dependent chlorinase/fluorinase [Frankia sp. CNm7]|uniref:SAM-dependent chlorinase/fluorinase n=1 Tax=Frankia nepalensis TaxID=1836974 RepID=A0A937RMW3_9ACTN|nr:SAM-dependent chlorinase/fluorinase [Frankia nepalensis]MBL7496432.1 SAM-dependent chlorinase/fluorinase [Frankia nepalensis]MBL7512846.1 SAM-dependent chlorinase/fluorinase [Frankia nepalensis]MBL7518349.1 SAM-dependent chlorinase/fluorinase [Frankia nepalensis]MBL7630219.1 SAM-dependent chlorinase/fluorinase [Frankia nepalensis]
MDAVSHVSFLTDYGLADGFVAACHGVLLRRGVSALDITHLIDPGDVRRGAAVLAQTVRYLPVQVHLAVVDPGVGTSRRGVVVVTPGGLLVGPDNGLLAPAAAVLGGVTEAYALAARPGVPATFHGRDVFAPAAAELATGTPPRVLGEAVDPRGLVRMPPALARVLPPAEPATELEAEVVMVDRFGNVQLAASGGLLGDVGLVPGGRAEVRFAAGRDREAGDGRRPMVIPVGVTFGSVEPGELVLYVDSAGMAAFAVRDGHAAERLGLVPGDVVTVSPC